MKTLVDQVMNCFNQGNRCLNGGFPQKAVEHYNQALSTVIKPELRGVEYGFGTEGSGELVDDEEMRAMILHSLGCAYTSLANKKESIEDFKKSIEYKKQALNIFKKIGSAKAYRVERELVSVGEIAFLFDE